MKVAAAAAAAKTKQELQKAVDAEIGGLQPWNGNRMKYYEYFFFFENYVSFIPEKGLSKYKHLKFYN